MKNLLFILSSILSLIAIAEEKYRYEVTDIKPQEGVFIMTAGGETILLELKKEHFRYWFSSNVIIPGKKKPKYPLKGKYKIKGNAILIEHNHISQKEWTFRKINSTVTLWYPDAIEYYQKEKKLYDYGILRFTSKSAEKAWDDQSKINEESTKAYLYPPLKIIDSKEKKKSPKKIKEEELDLIEK